MANVNMEHLERELICPICEDYFTTPLLLPCHHNVCHRCAKTLLSGASDRCSFHASSESLHSVGELSNSGGATTPISTPRPSSASAASNGKGKSRKPSLASLSGTPTSPLDSPGGGFNTAHRSSMRRSFRKRDSVTGSGPITPKERMRSRHGTDSPRPESPTCESPRPSSPRSDVMGPASTPRGRAGSTGSSGGRADSFNGSGFRGRTSSTGKLNGPIATSIHCPTCDEDVALGDKGINGLFRNFALEVVVDRYKLAAKKAASIPCGSCKKRPPEDATKSCLDCKSPYCTECFAIHHPWGTPRAQHVCIGPTYNYRPKNLTCTDHQGEKITMYCEGCHKPICHRCKYSGSHAEHKVSIIERKYTAIKDKMEQTLAAIASRRQNITTQVQKLEKIFATLEESSGDMQKALAEALAALQSTLNEKSASLTQRATDEVARRTENIGEILQKYKRVLEGCSAADLASELLKETDKAMFVQAAKPLVGRLVETARSLKQTEEMCDDYDTFGNFTLNSADALKRLQELDFMQAPGQPILRLGSSNNHQLCLEWTPSSDGDAAETYTIEYMKLEKRTATDAGSTDRLVTNGNDHSLNGHEHQPKNDEDWTTIPDLTECRFELADLEMSTSYQFRVKACNPAGTRASECLVVRSPPAPVLPFKWIPCQSNLLHSSSKVRKDGQEVVVSLSSSAFSTDAWSFPTSPVAIEPVHFVGDKKLSSGRHYWEVRVEQPSLAIHVGVSSERMTERLNRSGSGSSDGGSADRDSGHDSCDELDDDVLLQDPTVFVTHCMGRINLPNPPMASSTPRKSTSRNSTSTSPRGGSGSSPRSCGVQSNVIGVLLDTEAGRVSFYDGLTRDCLFSKKIKVAGVIQPAISIIGSGAIRLN